MASLPWFKVAPDFADHPKTQALASILNISQAAALGIVMRAWCWTAKYCPNGEISAAKVESLTLKVGHGIYQQFDADPLNSIYETDVFNALLNSGWIDSIENGDFQVHEWAEFNSAYFQGIELRKAADREAKQKRRQDIRKTSARHPQDVRKTSARRPAEIGTPDIDRDQDIDQDQNLDHDRDLEKESSSCEIKIQKAEVLIPPLSQAKKRGRPPKPTSPQFSALQAALIACYLEARGEKYLYGGAKDTEAIKRLLATELPQNEITRRFKPALKHEDKYLHCDTISEFASKFNKYANGKFETDMKWEEFVLEPEENEYSH